MKILNTEPLDFSMEAKRIYASLGQYCDSDISVLNTTQMTDVDVLIVRLGAKIDSGIMDMAPRLKFISSATTGLDHIDMEEASKRGIQILSLRGEDAFLDTIPSTADLTFGLILSLLRNIPSSYTDVMRGKWDRNKFRGHQLKGKKIGLIGLGRIGKIMASYCASFGMEVGYYDVKSSIAEGSKYKSFASVEDLLSWSDIVSVHIHLTSENTNFLNKERLSLMKKNSWFINTSRGGIVDELALASLVKENKIMGVAVDVLSDELDGEIIYNPLWMLAREGYNVIITPHIGGASFEAMNDCEVFMANKLVRTLNK